MQIRPKKQAGVVLAFADGGVLLVSEERVAADEQIVENVLDLLRAVLHDVNAIGCHYDISVAVAVQKKCFEMCSHATTTKKIVNARMYVCLTRP